MKKHLVLLVVCLLSLSFIVFAANEPVNYSGDDLAKWNHPVKAVFAQNNINLLEVDSENQVNYSFAVEFDKDLTIENEAYYDKLVKDIAKEVRFNNFEINDDNKQIYISVTCEKGAVTKVVYNDNFDYFKDLRAFVAKEAQLKGLLLKNIPELANLEKMMVKNDSKAKMVIYILEKPNPDGSDKYEKEYYTISIDQISGEDQDTLDQFLIHKDTNEIVWKDAENDQYLTLTAWRKLSTSTPYWPDLFVK